MDVDKTSLYPLLLDILTDISESHIVAIDLELSGIPSRKLRRDQRGNLQERYDELKKAADRFQVLQFGMTCVSQDVLNGKYILKPYNFDINPLVPERLGVDRVFAFQSGAIEFLLSQGFDISRPFKRGVPYLSRIEAVAARERHLMREDKSAIQDVPLKPTEVDAIAFVELTRKTIKEWMAANDTTIARDLSIGSGGNAKQDKGKSQKEKTQDAKELTRFEKRLVYQLVRSEFPELVAYNSRGRVKIARFDKTREDKLAAERQTESDARINKQKGLRWVVEALLGSDLSKLNLRDCAFDPQTGESIVADISDYRARLNRAQSKFRGRPRVLVGHNCFLDLVYMFRTFIGPLPDTVEDFQTRIHAMWPLIVDTKYMCTHNCSDINPISSLEQTAKQLGQLEQPVLEVPKKYSLYAKAPAFHEAGYDSYLTATVAVRLAAKLEREGNYVTPSMPGLGKQDEAPASSSPPAWKPSEAGIDWQHGGDPTISTDSVSEITPRDYRQAYDEVIWNSSFEGGMPALSSDFWRVYGNKLRVFGTDESVLTLGD
ncbi:CAF1-domain-containing protein [Piedraia hortae CBS 480.64]|uniref:CAF1-domain-containing protein n=1 Tax=Piedraia hortae CBS 480.64 TaxID=1314780 RepID=A0A6A7C5C1_9PEZI|nr:CAF1-domain-containing protein [Piedraia hortae CBS 480.64]